MHLPNGAVTLSPHRATSSWDCVYGGGSRTPHKCPRMQYVVWLTEMKPVIGSRAAQALSVGSARQRRARQVKIPCKHTGPDHDNRTRDLRGRYRELQHEHHHHHAAERRHVSIVS